MSRDILPVLEQEGCRGWFICPPCLRIVAVVDLERRTLHLSLCVDSHSIQPLAGTQRFPLPVQSSLCEEKKMAAVRCPRTVRGRLQQSINAAGCRRRWCRGRVCRLA